MIMVHHLCVGGPLDGKWISQADCVNRFEVIEGPELDWRPGSASEIRPEQVAAFVYCLIRTPDRGYVWKLRQ